MKYLLTTIFFISSLIIAEVDLVTIDDWNIFSSTEYSLIISKDGSNDTKQFLGFKMEQPWCVCKNPVIALKADDELEEGDIRLLTVDNHLVLPANKNIHVLVTGGDVLHSFAMPSLGVKKDAVPGRLNETWFNIDEPGIYRGQCSEICGTGHGFMPIVIEALNETDFNNWIIEQKNKLAMSPTL